MLLCFYEIPTKTLMMQLRFIILCCVSQGRHHVPSKFRLIFFWSSLIPQVIEFLISKSSRYDIRPEYSAAVIWKYFFQKILEELQGSGWTISNQEEDDHLAASDLKKIFIEADKERRNSSGLVVQKRVKLLIILEIFLIIFDS